MNLQTNYLGLTLENPLIAGASGLTAVLESIRKIAAQRPGAIVLRSLFEEEILAAAQARLDAEDAYFWYPEAAAQVRELDAARGADAYLRLIEAARKAAECPVIASIHALTARAWPAFAARIEAAGAAGLELNISMTPSDARTTDEQILDRHLTIVKAVRAATGLPLAVKISPHLSNPARAVQALAAAGAAAVVLFNRYFRADLDIERLAATAAPPYSAPEELLVPLRWILLLSPTAGCDLAASTGAHDAAGAIKLLLAGAAAVQVVTTLYRHGPERLGLMRDGLAQWMVRHQFKTLAAFRGRLARDSRAALEFDRLQFLRQTAGGA